MTHAKLWTVRGLLVIAIGVACYMAYATWSEGSVAGCGPQSGCDEVLRSRWGYWFGVPVSVLAVPVYLGLLGTSFRLQPGHPSSASVAAAKTLSLLILGAAAWFVALQAFVLGDVCRFCLTAHATSGAAAVLAFVALRREGPSAARPGVVLSAAVALGVLVAGQSLSANKSYSVERVPAQAGSERPGEAAASAAVSRREGGELLLHSGRFTLELDEVPLVGSAGAEGFIVSFFDYTCHFCRKMHEDLNTVRRVFGDQLGIVSLALPFDSACNPMLSRTPPSHANACKYAALGLAVWRVAPERYAEWDAWIFHGDIPSLEQARSYAERLAGDDAVEQALNDPWIQEHLARNIEIMQANRRRFGKAQLPQLIIGDIISVGVVDPIDELYPVIERELGIRRLN